MSTIPERGLAVALGAVLAIMSGTTAGATAQEPEPQGRESRTRIDALIDSLYAAVSFEPGEIPDWDRARSFFLPEALLVVAPRGPGSGQVMDLEAWIRDFVEFHEQQDIATKGFHEAIANREVVVYGNIAHAFVVFEPRIGPSWEGPTIPGVDSIEMVRHGGRWWIVAITTQFSSPEMPIPDRFRDAPP